MDVSVIVALITLAGSALGTFAGIAVNSKLTSYRIEQLEKKVDKHNKVIERTTELETWKESVVDELKEIKQKLQRLEEFHMKG
jgi:predicted nuclease with TOPRIM domain